jgi:RNA polymerase sigma-70 factor, ECF subfamily
MTGETQHQVTRLLEEAYSGRKDAEQELFRLVYRELHDIAVRRMRLENPGNLLQPTALVNETYIRLFGKGPTPLNNRQHFFSVAAVAMREILIDQARSERAQKRGSRPIKVDLKEWMQVAEESSNVEIDIKNAIAALRSLDERCAKIMDWFIFCGFTAPEIAGLLEVNRRTVEREIASGRLFLKRYLTENATHS